jgi:hypothetical protein
VILPDFEHLPGVHCGSTALANALRTSGVELSEPMVFGLGAGLGFYYLSAPELSPSHFFQGRTAHLERTACEVLGVSAVARTAEDPVVAWDGVRSALERGVAPILTTELSELPYWRTRTRFGGHRIVIAGHDPEREIALVSDTDRPGLEEVPLETLARARASVAPPFGTPGNPWLEIDGSARPRPLPDAVRDALRRQAREMLLDQDGFEGVSALERFAAELPDWPERAQGEADRVWCFRFAYQLIERRGTGGGLFRTLYAAFLREAERRVPSLAGLGLAARMEALAAGWSRLAAGLREVGDAPRGGVPPAVAAQARSLAEGERAFHEDVAARVP